MAAQDINVNINQNFNVGGQGQLENTTQTLERSQNQANETRDAFKGVRLEFLGVMFGGQQLANQMSRMTSPIKDLIGLQDLWQAQLIKTTSDSIPTLIDSVQAGGKIFETLDTAMGGNLGTMALFGQAAGQTVGTLGQMTLFLDSIGASIKSLGGLGISNLANIIKKSPIAGAVSGSAAAGRGRRVGFTPVLTGLNNTAFTVKGRSVTWGSLLAGGVVIGDLITAGVRLQEQIREEKFGKAIGSSLDAGFSLAGLAKIARGQYAAGITLSFAPNIAARALQVGTTIGEKTAEGIGQSFIKMAKKTPGTKMLVTLLGGFGASLQEFGFEIGLLQDPKFKNRTDQFFEGAENAGLLPEVLSPPDLSEEQRRERQRISNLIELTGQNSANNTNIVNNIQIPEGATQDPDEFARQVEERIAERFRHASGGRDVTFPG